MKTIKKKTVFNVKGYCDRIKSMFHTYEKEDTEITVIPYM